VLLEVSEERDDNDDGEGDDNEEDDANEAANETEPNYESDDHGEYGADAQLPMPAADDGESAESADERSVSGLICILWN
jgi:hypothetical protein